MVMKSDCNSSCSTVTSCGNCGVEERRLLHHVRHRGIFRRLCTSCVLRLHPQYFCPTCFQVYIPAPSNDEFVTCYKCYSSAHSHCVSVGPASTHSPYVCTLCIDPSNPIFELRTAKEASFGVDDSRSGRCRVMNRDEAKKLLAAAKIASASMNKAAVAAKVEAERRAKEAAFTRKMAKEALEHVAYLVVKEKLRMNKAEMSGSGTCGGVNVPQSKIVLDVNSRNGIAVPQSKIVLDVNSRNGIAVTGRVPSVGVEERVNAVEEMDSSSQLLAALNTGESMVHEQMDETKAECVGSEVPSQDDIAVNDSCVDVSMMVSDEDNTVRLASMQNTSNDGCHSSFIDKNIGAVITGESIAHENVDGIKVDEVKTGLESDSEMCFDGFIEVMRGDVECARVSDKDDNVELAAKHNNGADICHSHFVDENIGAFTENESVLNTKMDDILVDTIGSKALSDDYVEVMIGNVEGSEKMNEGVIVGCGTEQNNGTLDDNIGALNGIEPVLHEEVDELKSHDIGSEALPNNHVEMVVDGDVEGNEGMNEDSILGCATERNNGNDSRHSSPLDENNGLLKVNELISHEMKAENAVSEGAQVNDIEVMDEENTVGLDTKQNKRNGS